MSDEIAKLEDIALAFCRECLGVDSTLCEPDGDRWGFIMKKNSAQQFYYTDLDEVIDEVCRWCRSTGTGFSFHYSPLSGYAYSATIMQTASVINNRCHGYMESNNLCMALMGACLEAKRNIKKAA